MNHLCSASLHMFGYQVSVPQGSYGVPLLHIRGQHHPHGLAWSGSVPIMWGIALSASGSQLSLVAETFVSTPKAAKQRAEPCSFVSVTSCLVCQP